MSRDEAVQARHGRDHGPWGSDPVPAGRWYYVGAVGAPAFENGWENATEAGVEISPLRFRWRPADKVQIIGAVDGGALGTVCFTLPVGYRPATDVQAAVASADGTRVMTVSIVKTGEVTVVGIPTAAPPGGPTGAAGGALDGSYPNPGLAASVAGSGLSESSDVLAVNVDGTTLEISSDALRVKDGGITESKQALADVTTLDVSTTKHGYVPKAPNDTGKFLRGDGTWAAVGGVTSVVSSDVIWDAKGDIAAGTGADAADNLAVGSNGKVLVAASGETTGLKWDHPPGYEFDYAEITSPVTVSANAWGSATTVVSGATVTYDGSTRVCIEVYTPLIAPAADDFVQVGIFDGSTQIGIILESSVVVSGTATGTINHTAMGRRFYTPSNGSHQFIVKAIRGSANGTVYGEAGTTTAREPAYLRITKA